MPPKKDDKSFLWDMLDAARAVRNFVSSRTYHDYLNNRMLRNAVERNIEIIGEAAGKIGKEFKAAHPEVPWQQIISQRHVLAHEYGELEDEMLWKVATIRVPELIPILEKMLPSTPETE